MKARGPALAAATAAALAMLLAAGWADTWFRGGLDVSYRTSREDRIVEVDRTVEHRTVFPNVHRVLSRYVQAWDFDAWGVPNQMPDLDARIRTRLTIPEGPPLLVQPVSPNATDLLAGNQRVEGPLAPGTHDLTIFWHGPIQPPGTTHWTRLLPTSFKLRWGVDEESLTTIPRDAFALPADVPNPDRILLWVLAGLGALLLGLGVFLVMRAPTERARGRRGAVLATMLLLAMGLGYRLFDYSSMPEFRENMDELFATWNGYSLLDDGTTLGWTLWPERYGGIAQLERIEYWRERPISVVTPYFEHPPLLHLMAGAAAHLGGAHEFMHARLAHTRLVPIGLGVLTLLLVILVGRRLYPESLAPWFAGILYATMPYLVLMNRVIKEEALLAPLAMGGLLFFLRWRDDGERTGDLVAAAALTGLCTLAKVPGLVFVVALVVLVAQRRRPRAALIAAVVGGGVSGLLLVYAAAIDWNLFWYVTRDQATIRGSSWDQFVPFFYDTLVNHNRVGRAWTIFLWIAFVTAAFSEGRRGVAVLTVPAIAYLVGIGLASGSWHYGWYLLPIQPLLCLGAGRFLADAWEKPELLRGTLFVVLPVMYGLSFLFDPKWVGISWNADNMRHWVRGFTVVFLLPYGIVTVFSNRVTKSLARAATAVGMGMLVVVHGIFVVRYESLYETHANFDDATLCDRCEEIVPQAQVTTFPGGPASGTASDGDASAAPGTSAPPPRRPPTAPAQPH